VTCFRHQSQEVDQHAVATMSTTHSSSPLAHLSNNIKPHPNEALLRLRSSSLALLSVFLVTNLLPLPNPLHAWKVVFSGHAGGGPIWWGLCCAELALLSILLLNTLQSIYAIKYPRAPLPSGPSSTKRLKIASTPAPKTKKRLSTLSSNVRLPFLPKATECSLKCYGGSFADIPATPTILLILLCLITHFNSVKDA
jgi:hypothetical protein